MIGLGGVWFGFGGQSCSDRSYRDISGQRDSFVILIGTPSGNLGTLGLNELELLKFERKEESRPP